MPADDLSWRVLFFDTPEASWLYRKLLGSPHHCLAVRRIGPDAWLAVEQSFSHMLCVLLPDKVVERIASNAVADITAVPRPPAGRVLSRCFGLSCVLVVASLLNVPASLLTTPRRLLRTLRET